jgi:hypothetical protein
MKMCFEERMAFCGVVYVVVFLCGCDYWCFFFFLHDC